jgi:hypothetical protein
VDKKTEVLVHILAPPDVEVADLKGAPLTQAEEDGQIRHTGKLGRFVGYATPHPAQGLRLLLRAKSPFEGKTLTAWCSIEGKDYLKREYALRGVALKPLASRIDDFLLSIWGGGIDTQGTLPNGSPQQVRDEVRRNIEAFAPGGGFVFNTVHNIQADVPPENIAAMYDALAESGSYR